MSRPASPALMSAAFLALASLAGCAGLEPKYHRPAAPVPAAWPTGPAYGVPADMPIADWREVFQDRKLSAVIEEALANSRELRVAIGQIAAARAQYHLQRAALLPTIKASAGASTGRDYTGLPPALGPAYANETLYTTSIGTTAYEVDMFGRVRSLTRAALDSYLATDEARRTVQITLVAETATDYLKLAADSALLRVSQQTVISGLANLDLAQRRLRGGIASQLDVSNAETVVEQAHADVARYTTQAAQDRNALDLVVGAPVATLNLPADVDDPARLLGTVQDALDSRVLLRRPDVRQAELTLKAANANIGAARAAFFPSISLTGSGGTTSVSLANLFTGGAGVWSFAPTLSVPIFDGGVNRSNLDYAKAQHRIDVALYEKAVQTAFREASDALAQRGTIAESLRAQRGLVAAAAVSLHLAEALYARGSDSYLDVLTAQQTLYGAQQALISTELAHATNIVTLYKVLGGGLNDRTGSARIE